MNNIMIIGNLTKDPEVRSTPNGVAVCNLTVAVNRIRKEADGTQHTDFFDVVVWRQLAELCGKYLAKGRKISVIGEMNSRQYEDKNGNKRTGWSINADEIEFLTPSANAQQTRGAVHEQNNQSFTEVYDDDMPF